MPNDHFFKPSVTADTVCFAFDDEKEEILVLLVRRANEPFKGLYAFPGGFLDEADEDMEACAVRELREETGVIVSPEDLLPLGCWSEKDRDPRSRVLTIAFVAIFEDHVPHLSAGDDAASAEWVPFNTLKPEDLAFDHAEIMAVAQDLLKAWLDSDFETEDQ